VNPTEFKWLKESNIDKESDDEEVGEEEEEEVEKEVKGKVHQGDTVVSQPTDTNGTFTDWPADFKVHLYTIYDLSTQLIHATTLYKPPDQLLPNTSNPNPIKTLGYLNSSHPMIEWMYTDPHLKRQLAQGNADEKKRLLEMKEEAVRPPFSSTDTNQRMTRYYNGDID
jgi:hypothetical protein